MKIKYRWLLAGALCCGCLLGNAGTMEASAAAIPMRGVVEGFYGTPWTQTDRLAMLKFMQQQGLNMYIYAPKDDPYHREKWREPYPEAELQSLKALIREARRDGVQFVFAISPGLDMRFAGKAGEEDLAALLTKFDSLYAAGVRQFAIFFDDIRNKDGQSQAAVWNAVNQRFIHKKTGVKPLLAVPTEYFSEDMVTKDGVKPYTKAVASLLDKDILVMYTGYGVVCEGISLADITKVEQIYGRKMAVWWNYPVSDYRRGKLALGPVTGMEAGAGEHMAAFLLNPMEHAAMSRLTLATGADYAADPAAYEPEASWEKAIGAQYGELAPAMRIFASHSQRMENNWAHVGRPDAPDVRAHMDAFWQAAGTGKEGKLAGNVLLQDFQQMKEAAKTLQAKLPERPKAESQPQLQLFMQLADAGENVVFMVQAKQNGQARIAELFYQKLLRQSQALPKDESVLISEKTAGAFVQEGLTWREQHK